MEKSCFPGSQLMILSKAILPHILTLNLTDGRKSEETSETFQGLMMKAFVLPRHPRNCYEDCTWFIINYGP